MASINVRPETGKLYFDFRYLGKRCREQTALDDTAENRKKMRQALKKIEAAIELGQFSYRDYFPNSAHATKFDQPVTQLVRNETPMFSEFWEDWIVEKKVEWRASHYDTVQTIFNTHLNPYFGDREVAQIAKVDILKFRSELAKRPGRNGRDGLSSSRVNHIMTALRMCINEAADRYEFPTPYRGIKSLKVPRTDVEPFTLEEVKLLTQQVRTDYKAYLEVRFFTGLRTAEVDGLKWKYVDFEKRLILIREARVRGEMVYTKNDSSFREVEMSSLVYEALHAQHKLTGELSEFVFCTSRGFPVNHTNFRNRVWYPLLRHLDLKKRRPYQTRHTAATLWLAAGENPEWIARQMGHTTTEMLFRVYSRYVPNLTRQDGSAFDNMLKAQYRGGE